MDFKKHLVSTWELTLKHLVPLVLMTLVMAVLSLITLGILAPVLMAGYMQSVLLMVREGREPKVNDVFSEMRLFLPLLFFEIVVFLAVAIGFLLLVLPGLLLTVALAFVCLYLLPLMTDKNLGLLEAVKGSYKLVTQDRPGEQVVVAILYWAIVFLGYSVALGWLLTQPFATVFLMSVYSEVMRRQKLIADTRPAERPESVDLRK